MKRTKILYIALVACLLLVPFGCNDNNDNPIVGNWKPSAVKINFTPVESQAAAIDGMIAQICTKLGIEPITLQTANVMFSALGSQVFSQMLTSFDVVDGGKLVVNLKDGTSASAQYSLAGDKFTVAIPAEVTGLPVAFPFQCKYTVDGKDLKLYLDKESLMALVNNPLFSVIMAALSEELGGLIDEAGIKMFLAAMESVEIAAVLNK